ncbi:MAG: quinone oxidoreductase [Pseudolabrys sp.]
MTKAIVLAAPGGPDQFALVEVDTPPPAPGEVQVRQTFSGVNFVDIYHRTGLYPLPGFPAVLGVDGAGVVEAVGDGVDSLAVGDRVAYAGLPTGGYIEIRNLPAERVVAIPATIDDRTAAAAMLRGVTAHMLLKRVHPVVANRTVLVHAAAGGLGLILTAWAKRLGARVIGTVGSPAKAELALSHGLDHAILYKETDFVADVRALTGGKGVDVAYDGIGADTLLKTFDAVRPLGMVASIGQAGGSLPDISLAELGPSRSLSLSRPSVFAYVNDLASYREATAALFAEIAAGLDISVGAELPLAEAARAHLLLENGETSGSILLVP